MQLQKIVYVEQLCLNICWATDVEYNFLYNTNLTTQDEGMYKVDYSPAGK